MVVLGAVAATVAGAPRSVEASPVVPVPAFCQVLTTLGAGLTIDAVTGLWPDPGAVTCRATGTGDVSEAWLTPAGSATAAAAAVEQASRSWATPQWLEGFEVGFGGGGENLPEGEQQRQNWYLYFARGATFVHVRSGWVVRPDPAPLDASSPIAGSVIAAARSLDSALQTPEVYGLPGAGGAAGPADPTSIISPFGDVPFTPEELDQVVRQAWPPPHDATFSTTLTGHVFDMTSLGAALGREALTANQAADVTRTQLSADQRAAIDTFVAALLLVGFRPTGTTRFPALEAMLPVLARLAAAASAPASDAGAALALTRTVRMLVALDLSMAISADRPATEGA